MIVREETTGLLLIPQPDHAALAARLMDSWQPLARVPRRDAILLAIAEHDNGWREPDAAPIVAGDGRVLDFVHAPDGVRRGVWPRGVERLAATPYAAALVAQHSITIFDRYRGDPGWQPFFDEMTRRRDDHLARSGYTASELAADYAFVRIGDLLSLVFCNAWREEHEHGGYRITLRDRSTLVVSGTGLHSNSIAHLHGSPDDDPFGGREIPFAIGARRLPAAAFASAEAARAAFERAPTELLHGRIAAA